MLYLEDYVEMIEHLPQELRDRFSEMRDLDLQVQNSMDSLDKRVSLFFSNAKKMRTADKETEFDTIKKEYYRNLEDADEKIELANNMSDLVGKYYRRLDQELHKFKMELEADNMGITEILEKRSNEKELPATNSISQKENRYSLPPQRSYYGEKRQESGALVVLPKQQQQQQQQGARPPVEVVGGTSTATSSTSGCQASSASTAGYGLSHMGQAGRTAIAAAASQAIAATQQMQQGRRTASLKASYEAIGGASVVGSSTGSAGSAAEISKEIAGAAQTAIAAIQDSHKKHKASASLSGSSGSGGGSGSSGGAARKSGGLSLVGGASPASLPSPDTPVDRSEQVDPNEARYCICNEVAYGTMVACDNKTCPYEWYHYPCVGITEKPKGKWYCPHCTAAMKRRNRKN